MDVALESELIQLGVVIISLVFPEGFQALSPGFFVFPGFTEVFNLAFGFIKTAFGVTQLSS